MTRWIRTLLDVRARFGISGRSGVDVAREARVAWRKMRFVDGCRLSIGRGSIVEATIAFDRPGGVVRIGERTFVGASLLVCAEGIEVGDDVLISWGCTIVDHDSHALAWKDRSQDVERWFNGQKEWATVRRAAVHIGNKAWIGFNASILKGVKIGEGAVVGAGSVVTRDVPPFTLVAGNPAQILRELAPHER